MIKLPTLEEMQSEKLLKSHRAGPLISFKYPKKVWGKGWVWDNTTLEARGIVYDSRTGECICRPFRKFFNAHEKECHASLTDSSLTVKLDGTCIASYLFEDQVCCKTLGCFDNDFVMLATPLVRRAIGNLVSGGKGFLKITTLIFEFFTDEDVTGTRSGSGVIKHKGPDKIVLLGARDIITGHLWSHSTLKMLAKQLQVELVEEITDLDAFSALKESHGVWDGLNEGWVGIDTKETMFKVKYSEYTALHKAVGKVNQLKYNKGRQKRSKYYQNAVGFILDHPKYVEEIYPNLDDILGALNAIVAELDAELAVFALEAKPYWATLSRKEKKKRLKTVPRNLHELIFKDNIPEERKRALLLRESAWMLDNPRKTETESH